MVLVTFSIATYDIWRLDFLSFFIYLFCLPPILVMLYISCGSKDVWFSLKSSLTINLNHSNRIINEQVMAKIQTLVKIEKQNTTCTGTALTCTGTTLRNLPRMWVFLPFFHMFSPKSTQYSIYTSKPLHIHLVVSIHLSIHIFLQNSFMNHSQNNSHMGHNPFTSQTQGLVRVCSKL